LRVFLIHQAYFFYSYQKMQRSRLVISTIFEFPVSFCLFLLHFRERCYSSTKNAERRRIL